MKKYTKICFIFIVLILALIGVVAAKEVEASGTTGNLTWTLYEDGVLIISGKGEMNGSPWRSYDNSITSVIIENGVLSIGDAAFSGCTRLMSIEIPDSVTSIGENPFDGCARLTSIEIPDNVTSIGEDAFTNTGLTSIVIPASVTSIGKYAFLSSSLKTIRVDNNNQFYSSIDGALGNKEKSRIICAPQGIERINIPASVTSIGERAFSACESLTNIEIPDSVTSIGYGAFYGCTNLTSIYISDSVTGIGRQAFSNCISLTSINIPNSIKHIESEVFEYCISLTSVQIPNSVKSIGYGAFLGCSSLTSIEIPASVTNIEDYAFENCSSMTSVYFCNSNNPKIADSVFMEDSLTAYYPSTWSKTPKKQYGGKITWVRVDAPVISKNPTAVTKTENQNASFTVSASGTNLTYQWQASSDGGNTWKNSGLTGNKTNKLTIKATTARNGYMFRCLITDCVGQTVTSNAAKLTVADNTNIVIASQPKNVTVDEGKNATFTVAASSSDGSELSFQWQASTDSGKTWKNSGLSGNKTATLTVAATATRNGYMFRCLITDSAGQTVTSDVAKLTVKAENASGTSEIASGTSGNLSWTLYDDGVLIISGKGVLTSSLINYSVKAQVKKIIINEGITEIGGSALSGYSNLKDHDIYLPDSINKICERSFDKNIHVINLPLCNLEKEAFWDIYSPIIVRKTDGQQYTISNAALDLMNDVVLFDFEDVGKYNPLNWYSGRYSGGIFPEKKFAYYSLSKTNQGNYYYLSDAVGLTDEELLEFGEKYSVLNFYGDEYTFAGLRTLTISTQPMDVMADEEKNAVFNVSASSSDGLEIYYQWQVSTDDGKTWSNSGLSGNKTVALTVAATSARNGYRFRCIVSDAAGNTVTSNAATLTVKSYIKFNSQPLNQKVTNATKVKFKVSAESLTGSTLSYQWQVSTDGGKTWKNSGLSGNKTAILVVEATAARSGYRFRCVVTDANGKSLTSSVAVMTVKKVAEQTVTISSFTASQTALAGTNVKFNVGAKTSTGTALTYQWQVSTDGGKTFKNSGLTGNKTATLTVAATAGRNNYQFRCVITDAKNNSIISDAVKMTVR